jgi:hypothetical protein
MVIVKDDNIGKEIKFQILNRVHVSLRGLTRTKMIFYHN